MPENETESIQETETSVWAETAMKRFEREQLSRRQALKKLGVTTAMATFAMFSVDDLAHMVGRAMQQQAADNKVVAQIAREFQMAGVVFAAGPSGSGGGSGPGGSYPCMSPSGVDCASQCDNQKTANDAGCFAQYGGGLCFRGNPFCPSLNNCLFNSTTARTNCYNWCTTNCSGQ